MKFVRYNDGATGLLVDDRIEAVVEGVGILANTVGAWRDG